MSLLETLRPIRDAVWEAPIGAKPGMRVPARIYATEALLEAMDAAVLDQIANVAALPGIVRHAMCMPDGHFGYGFPIGGVAATDVDAGGVISPGGIGFDINCGMRLVTTNLTWGDIEPCRDALVDKLFERVPAGVGSQGLLKLSKRDFAELVEQGARWCVDRGYGEPADLESSEEAGCIPGADAGKISGKAVERGLEQVGTLGSGNHYLEIQVAKEANIHDPDAARAMGITRPDQVVVMFHCGSRGFGHQVATDYLRRFLQVMQPKYGIEVRDRELACAPLDSPEGRDYFAAMKCGINMSYANRQVILHRIREVFSEVLGRSPESLEMRSVYDVAHNTAKLEEHEVDGETRRLLVHRKGATRAFSGAMPGVPAAFREVGQPVIIGGSMESGSYLLAGVAGGAETFFSTAHGSGRAMSRRQARRRWQSKPLKRQLKERGVYVRAASNSGLSEEAGGAYKDIDAVVEATERAGISKRVAKFTPVGNVKG